MVHRLCRFTPALLAVVATLLLAACGADMAPVTTDFKTTNLARDWRGEVVYQLMVDRFADGQRDNNKGVVVGDLGRYQGGDWQGVIDHVDYLKKLGVTSVWISPVVRNVESDAGYDGYHGYWTQDFLDVNPHFGDIAKLREMVQVLHANGILVILDVVANHVGQVFYYDINRNGRPDDSVQGTGTTSPILRTGEYDPDFDLRGVQAVTGLGASGNAPVRWIEMPELNRGAPRPAQFANFDWYWKRGRVTVWGRESEACRIAGIDPDANWQDCYNYVRTQEVTGDFPGGLKDLRTDLPEVRQALIEVMTYWITAADIDGFRIDTVKHVEHDFWIQFATAVRAYAKQVGKENFFMFGEVFDGADWLLGSYTQPKMLDSVFYFSQKFQVYDAVFKYGAPTSQIEKLWTERKANYGAVGNPDGVLSRDGQPIAPQKLLVNFLDNHDTPRFLFEQPDVKRLHLAVTLQFTQNGMPCIYYGTEQEFSGGNDPANREPLWLSNFGAFNTTNRTFSHYAKMARLRKALPELLYGEQAIHWSTERTGGEQDAGIFAFERRYQGNRVMVVLNTHPTKESETSADSLGFGSMTTTMRPGTVLRDLMPGADPAARFEVTDEGCETVACTAVVPDDYNGGACGCLKVAVPSLGARVLVPVERAEPLTSFPEPL